VASETHNERRRSPWTPGLHKAGLGDAAAGPVPAADLEDALFAGVRQKVESLIDWARSGEACRFTAARRPGLRPAGTGLLITADGPTFPVLPGALRPTTYLGQTTRVFRSRGWPSVPSRGWPSHRWGAILFSNATRAEPIAMCMSRYL
jgi:hypothetical protein